MEWPHGELNVWLGMANTFILIGSSVTMVMAWASLKLNDWGKHRLYLILTFVLADELDFAQGAGLILNYHTAYFSLIRRTRAGSSSSIPG